MKKFCKSCGRLLPVECFSERKSNKDGLYYECKDCYREHRKHWKHEREFRRDDEILGGYTIYILNHYSGKEKKYNIVGTNGERLFTNDKNEILNFFEKM
jgi:hypothetical protein